MFQAEATPKELLVAGLAAIGAIYVLADLLRQLDRLRMADVTTDELSRLPTTEERDGGAHTEGDDLDG